MRGSIVLMSSVLAEHPEPTLFATHAYAAAKAATIGMTRAMAAYYAPQCIRVNALAPSLVATPMSARAAADPDSVAFAERAQPLAGGFLDPDEVAEAALYLCVGREPRRHGAGAGRSTAAGECEAGER